MQIPIEDKNVHYIIHEDSDAVATRSGRMHRDASKVKTSITGRTNEATWHLVKNGYVVLRDVIPLEIRQIFLDTWKTMEYNTTYGSVFSLESPKFERVSSSEAGVPHTNTSMGEHSSPMGVAAGHWMLNMLSRYIDMHLQETYTYSRKYNRGSYLGAHTDRLSCEISTTYCLDFKSDDNTPWKLWMTNDGNKIGTSSEKHSEIQRMTFAERERNNCVSVSLYPGDVMVYMGPNIIHWRDQFVGDYTYQMFSHFTNIDGELGSLWKSYIANRMQKEPQIWTLLQKFDPLGGTGQAPENNPYLPLSFDFRENRYTNSQDSTDLADARRRLWVEFESHLQNGDINKIGQTAYDKWERV